MIYFDILVFIFGLVWGSFLNVVVWRFDDFKTIAKGRSKCPYCGYTLEWYDLIPLISYGILRGKCRKCEHKLSAMYPVIELITGVAIFLIYLNFGFVWQSLLLLIVVSVLMVTFGYDAIHMQISGLLMWIGIITVLIWRLATLSHLSAWAGLIPVVGWGAAIGIALPLVLVVISRGQWMGDGDILLGALIGVLAGYPNIFVAYFIAFVSGSIYGLTLVMLKGKSLKEAVPFGPFLVLGALTALFYGGPIINWYMNLSFLN